MCLRGQDHVPDCTCQNYLVSRTVEFEAVHRVALQSVQFYPEISWSVSQLVSE